MGTVRKRYVKMDVVMMQLENIVEEILNDQTIAKTEVQEIKNILQLTKEYLVKYGPKHKPR